MKKTAVDVLCIGMACYDIYFQIDAHPLPDDKIYAQEKLECGGGPAANAAVTVQRLGGQSELIAYLGDDFSGTFHHSELVGEGVFHERIIRGAAPTPLAVSLVKPNGERSAIAYNNATPPLEIDKIRHEDMGIPGAILFDGHQAKLSEHFLAFAREHGIPTILDAGSVHTGTNELFDKVDFLVASSKFACQKTKEPDPRKAFELIQNAAPTVIVTLGGEGIVWNHQGDYGSLAADSVEVVDTTGAGDVFHGAFAYAISMGRGFQEAVKYASVAAALSCKKLTARLAIPYEKDVSLYIKKEGSAVPTHPSS